MQEDLHICEKFRNFVGFLLCVYIYTSYTLTHENVSNRKKDNGND